MSLRWILAGLPVGLAMALALGGLGCGPTAPLIDVSAYPAQMQADYALFAERCSRCHGLERALNARVARGRWAAYVRRMSRNPGAGLGKVEQARITRFLEFHHHENAGAAPAPGATP